MHAASRVAVFGALFLGLPRGAGALEGQLSSLPLASSAFVSQGAEPFAELCLQKAASCDTMCKGNVREQSCSPTTGAWTCNCGVAPSISTNIGTTTSTEPYKAKCEEKKKSCDTLCKGATETNTCSSSTGAWSCKCGVVPSISTNVGSGSGAGWKQITVEITLSTTSALSTLMASIDATTWTLTKSVTFGKTVISAGDILLKEGAMAGQKLEHLLLLSSGTLVFKHKTTSTSKTTSKTTSETASWRKTGSWKKVSISVESNALLRLLVSKLDVTGGLTEDLQVGGLQLRKGDHVLKESVAGATDIKSMVTKLQTQASVKLMVDVRGLQASTSARRRRATVINACAKEKTKCSTTCGGAIAAWSCAFSSELGTKWSCQCSGSKLETAKELASSKRTIETTITSRSLLRKLIKSINIKTMTITKTIKIGSQTLRKGDKLLRELDLAQKITKSSSLKSLKTLHIKIEHRKTASEIRTDQKKLEISSGKTTKTETVTPAITPPELKVGKETKVESKTITLGSGSLQVRVRMLEELVVKLQTKVVSLEACTATCCAGKCVAPSPMPELKVGAPSPAAPSPKPAVVSTRRRRLSMPSGTPSPKASTRRRRLSIGSSSSTRRRRLQMSDAR